ncbi:nitronate monooxygenase [Thermodesulfovibrionales bacterium]|nr:nitronate monooxygenase [Thermodesulfovibrionales bacterium]
MFKTRITELFDIELPIIQGGMLWLSRAELVAAVSNAGGLGILSAATFANKEELKDEIQKTRSLTSKPIGVNIPLFPAIRPPDVDGYIKVMAEEGVTIAETAGRNPVEYIPLFQECGIKVMHKVTAVRFARKAVEIGCQAVVIDGFECAGHPGEEDVSSTVLLPATVDAVDIPVIAAGGFADGRGLVAALAFGAEGVLMGTRFMLSKEAPMCDEIKQYLTSLNETDTMVVLRSLRNSARVIKNEVAEKVATIEAKGNVKIEELLPFVSGLKEKEVMETGDLSRGLIHCGQVIGLINDYPPVQEIMEQIMEQAVEVVSQMTS